MRMKFFITIATVFVIWLPNHTSALNDLQSTEETTITPDDESGNSTVLSLVNTDEHLEKRCNIHDEFSFFKASIEPRHRFTSCTNVHYNQTEMAEKLERASLTGTTNKVHRESCAAIPALKNCFTDYDDEMEHCLDENERLNQKIAQNMTNALFDFLCADGASSMTRFYETGGFECITTQQEKLSECLNDGSAGTLVILTYTLLPWPRLLNSTDCGTYMEVQACIVKNLQACTDQTPSILTDSLLNRIKQVTPCWIQPETQTPAST